MPLVAQILLLTLGLAIGGGMTLTGAMCVAEAAFEDDAELRNFASVAGWIIGAIGLVLFVVAAASLAATVL